MINVSVMIPRSNMSVTAVQWLFMRRCPTYIFFTLVALNGVDYVYCFTVLVLCEEELYFSKTYFRTCLTVSMVALGWYPLYCVSFSGVPGSLALPRCVTIVFVFLNVIVGGVWKVVFRSLIIKFC